MNERALISVTDKTGITELAEGLVSLKVDVVASGGTADAIEAAGIPVIRVEEITEYPSILDGRVKTLHPLIFGGILGDTGRDSHLHDMEKYGIHPFALVVCNFYDFRSASRESDIPIERLIEKIDIGGPSMLRAAAKNHASSLPLFNPSDYSRLLKDLEEAGSLASIPKAKRLRYSAAAFGYTAEYEALIAGVFGSRLEGGDTLPDRLHISLKKTSDLRYGENPFQKAALYSSGSANPWEQLQGKELSYNNYADLQSAREIVLSYSDPASSIIKHSNPCGFGTAGTLLEAYKLAVSTDPVSYFGGIVGFNRKVDEETAAELAGSFLECIIAPGFSEEALRILGRKKNLRLIRHDDPEVHGSLELKVLDAGVLVQERDILVQNPSEWTCVTDAAPDETDMAALKLGWDLVRHVKSNAVVFAAGNRLLGVGAGQMSRVDSVKIAVRKAGEAGLDLNGSILASDAFFPFADAVDLVKDLGIKGIIQPGGSVRDQEVIDACNREGLFMLFTHKRHFRH